MSRIASIRQSAARLGSFRGTPRASEVGVSLQKPVLLENGYMVLSSLASGGQGEVFKATRRSGGQQTPSRSEQKSDAGSERDRPRPSRSGSKSGGTLEDSSALGNFVAIKFMRIASDKHREELLNEVQFLQELDHPNIVRLYEVIEDRNAMYVVTEFLNGGDLLDRITKGAFTETQTMYFAEKVLSILAFIHKQGITHRDLKLENFMLHSTNSDEVIKLIDFGMAHRRKPKETKLLDEDWPGTRAYEAPEILRRVPYNPEKVDIWCTGIMLYTAVEKVYPFEDPDDAKLSEMIRQDEPSFASPQWALLGEPFKKMVVKMLAKDASKRPTADQALQQILKLRAALVNSHTTSMGRAKSENVKLSKTETPLMRFARSLRSKKEGNGMG
ncbi:Calcium/calmodulin-dependent protein kinase type 1 [Porphyridium purpureum]|uniref:Calcium/calmodulin-dependent protein kinase type 1 n=1 Tax=Porphyridium purpureum TaxID=35688 RepID=A0A5J4Z385_PORPP|nr:Calcium/calmodulin-dependent protein kinase type 1 [Porphyridium purpureum]|eukprot:POR2534..scf295_1